MFAFFIPHAHTHGRTFIGLRSFYLICIGSLRFAMAQKHNERQLHTTAVACVCGVHFSFLDIDKSLKEIVIITKW